MATFTPTNKNSGSFTAQQKTVTVNSGFILLENGGKMLMESGDRLLQENASASGATWTSVNKS